MYGWEMFCFCFETRSHFVALIGLKLGVWTGLASNSQRSICFYFLNVQPKRLQRAWIWVGDSGWCWGIGRGGRKTEKK